MLWKSGKKDLLEDIFVFVHTDRPGGLDRIHSPQSALDSYTHKQNENKWIRLNIRGLAVEEIALIKINRK
jgi:hypothetical protein